MLKYISLILFSVAVISYPSTFDIEKHNCFICDTNYSAVVTLSGTSHSIRTDLKPIGSISAPFEIPVCPKCNFVIYKNKFSKEEIAKLKPFVLNSDYSTYSKKYPSYFLAAKLMEHLKEKQEDIAYAYLRASWQKENDNKLYLECVKNSQAHFKVFLDTTKEKTNTWKNANFLLGELHRLQSSFKEAKQHFNKIRLLKEFDFLYFKSLIDYELKLIKIKSNKAVEIPNFNISKEAMGIELCRKMKGYDKFKNSFEIKSAKKTFDDELDVVISSITNEKIKVARWNLPIINDLPKYNWSDFKNIYNDALEKIEKIQWVEDWLSSSNLKYIQIDIKNEGTISGEYLKRKSTECWSLSKYSGKPRYMFDLYGYNKITPITFVLSMEHNSGIIISAQSIDNETQSITHAIDTLNISYGLFAKIDSVGNINIIEY